MPRRVGACEPLDPACDTLAMTRPVATRQQDVVPVPTDQRRGHGCIISNNIIVLLPRVIPAQRAVRMPPTDVLRTDYTAYEDRSWERPPARNSTFSPTTRG